MTITASDAQNLKGAIQSMRLFNRAEIKESRTGESLVEKFHEDPYPTGHLLSEIKSARHTFIVGRRGTGKSTAFQKARLDLRTKPGVLTAYVNLKSVGESANHGRIDLPDGAAGRHARQIIWFRSFIKHLLKELSIDLRKKNSEGFFRVLSGRKEQAARELKKLEEDNRYLRKLDLDAQVATTVGISHIRRAGFDVSAGANLAGPSAAMNVGRENVSTNSEQLAGTRYNIFDVREFVTDLQETLKHLRVDRLYLFLDDYSELDDTGMGFLMDEVVEPLSAVSEEFLTFKIAVYPNRFYTGRLDPASFDVLRTDFADIYSLNPAGTIEGRGAQFIERVIKKRLDYYCRHPASYFFAMPLRPPLYELLFQASFANIRALGNILQAAYTDATAYQRKITVASIEVAARKHFEDKVEREMLRFGGGPETARALKQLQLIVEHAKKLKTSSAVHDGRGRPVSAVHSSHFFVERPLAELLESLLQRQAVHHYTDAKASDGREVAIFALDFGLCQKENIAFGKPSETTPATYFTQPEFDLSALLTANSIPIVAPLSRSEAPNLREILFSSPEADDLGEMTETQRLILDAIYEAGPRVGLLARQIAGAIDLSPVIVGKAASELNRNGFVVRERVGAVYSYRLSDNARAVLARRVTQLNA